MVVFTIFAAESFDPRLLWDNHQKHNHNTETPNKEYKNTDDKYHDK